MKILMVCLGNICRSPLAHGIMQSEIDRRSLNWEVDSAGTAGYHEGELPDTRSIEVARSHNIDITDQRSRKLQPSDLDYYDHILVMDSSNYNDTLRLVSSPSQSQKIKLLLNYSKPGSNRAVPDPYYEGGFDSVFEMIREAILHFITSHS